jgi:hypothetical protein
MSQVRNAEYSVDSANNFLLVTNAYDFSEVSIVKTYITESLSPHIISDLSVETRQMDSLTLTA